MIGANNGEFKKKRSEIGFVILHYELTELRFGHASQVNGHASSCVGCT